MKRLVWLVFLSVSAFMFYLDYLLSVSGYGIIDLQFADATKGNIILTAYQSQNLLFVVVSHLKFDFLYLILYVWLMITLSTLQMQREKWLPLNQLLKLNVLLALLVGSLDVVENMWTFHNLRHIGQPNLYWSTYWLALSKFALAAWVVLVWLVSVVKVRGLKM